MLPVGIHHDQTVKIRVFIEKVIKGGLQCPAFAEIDGMAQNGTSKLFFCPPEIAVVFRTAAVVDYQHVGKAAGLQIRQQAYHFFIRIQRWDDNQYGIEPIFHVCLSLFPLSFDILRRGFA